MKEIIIAMDSFKGSMTSLEAGNAIKKAIQNIHPAWNIQVYPVADGGEGTLEALTYQQKVTRRTCMITGPLGNPIEASYLWYERNLEKTAVIEMAQAAGLPTEQDFATATPIVTTPDSLDGIFPQLAQLMEANHVFPEELQQVVGEKGYFPADMPVNQYPQDFVEGWCIPWWKNIFDMIQQNRNVPF